MAIAIVSARCFWRCSTMTCGRAVPRIGTPVAWLALAALLVAAPLPHPAHQAAATALWAPLMPLAAAAAGFGFPLLLAAGAPSRETAALQRRRLLSPGFVLIALGSLVWRITCRATTWVCRPASARLSPATPASAHTDVDERARGDAPAAEPAADHAQLHRRLAGLRDRAARPQARSRHVRLGPADGTMPGAAGTAAPRSCRLERLSCVAGRGYRGG